VAKSAAQISTRLSATQLSGDLSGVPAIALSHQSQRRLYKLLADRTDGRELALMLGSAAYTSSVTLGIVAKRCVLEQKLLLTAYRNSYMRKSTGTKMTLTFV